MSPRLLIMRLADVVLPPRAVERLSDVRTLAAEAAASY